MSLSVLKAWICTNGVRHHRLRPTSPNLKRDAILKVQQFSLHRLYSTQTRSDHSLENCRDVAQEIDALSSRFEKEGDLISNLTLPREGLNPFNIRKLLKSISMHKTVLPACGSTNPSAAFTTAKIFLKPDFDALKELEPDLRAAKKIWGYQMQNIPLDEVNIERLSNHILEIYKNNTVVLTIDANASAIFRPEINSTTRQPDLSDRTFAFFNEANEFSPFQHRTPGKEDL